MRKSHTPSVEPDPRKALEKARKDLAALVKRILSSSDRANDLLRRRYNLLWEWLPKIGE
jgi:hypothetical protein